MSISTAGATSAASASAQTPWLTCSEGLDTTSPIGSLSATVGYRWMKVDRNEGAFLYDVIQQGVMVGAEFRF